MNGLPCLGVQGEAKAQFLDCIQNVDCDFCEHDTCVLIRHEDGSEPPVSQDRACSYGSWAAGPTAGTNEAVGSNGAQGVWIRRSGATVLWMGMDQQPHGRVTLA